MYPDSTFTSSFLSQWDMYCWYEFIQVHVVLNLSCTGHFRWGIWYKTIHCYKGSNLWWHFPFIFYFKRILLLPMVISGTISFLDQGTVFLLYILQRIRVPQTGNEKQFLAHYLKSKWTPSVNLLKKKAHVALLGLGCPTSGKRILILNDE